MNLPKEILDKMEVYVDNYGPSMKDIVRDAMEEGYFLAHQWIPVSERLPEVNQTVLAVNDLGDAHSMFIDVRYSWRYNLNEDATLYNVTHWQPLPPKPNP